MHADECDPQAAAPVAMRSLQDRDIDRDPSRCVLVRSGLKLNRDRVSCTRGKQ